MEKFYSSGREKLFTVHNTLNSVEYWGLFEHPLIRKEVINSLDAAVNGIKMGLTKRSGKFAFAFIMNSKLYITAAGYRAYLIEDGKITFENDPKQELAILTPTVDHLILSNQNLTIPKIVNCSNLHGVNPTVIIYCINLQETFTQVQAEMPAKISKQAFQIGKSKYTHHTFHPPRDYRKSVESRSKPLEELKEGTKLRKYTRAGDIESVPDRMVHQIVADYIKKHKLKLYGGTAINKYIGRKDKFYTRAQLPDYDVYSDKPWFHAKAIVDELYAAGYQYVDAHKGLHYGTIKVFANFWPVADVTFLPTKMLKKVPTQKKDGFEIVDPRYLFIDMYRELAIPYDDPSRWGKVAYRQKLLQEWAAPKYRVKQCQKSFKGTVDEALTPVLGAIDHFAKKYKLLYYGPSAYNTYIDAGDGDHYLSADTRELLTDDLETTTTGLLRELKSSHTGEFYTEEEYYMHKVFNKHSNLIVWVNKDVEYTVAMLTEMDTCVPYKYMGGRYIVSIDYLKYELYFRMSVVEAKEVNVLSCVIRYLNVIQSRYYKKHSVTEFDNSPFQRFIQRCKGPYIHGLKKTLRERKDEYYKTRSDTVALKPAKDVLTLHGVQGRQIRIYPKSEISKECVNVKRKDCFFPCAWNDTYERCFDLPIGGYDPEVPELEKQVTEDDYYL